MERPSAKHIAHIRATIGCGINEAKKISIKHSIKKMVKKAESIEELKHQMLRIVELI